MKLDTNKLIRKLNRFKEQKELLESKHLGKELEYTYWGGYSLGELKGKISIIENILDEIGDE